VLQEAAVLRMSQRNAKGKLIVNVADNLPAIDVDPVLFRRALDSVLENAPKSSPDTQLPISLTVAAQPSGVVFTIVDSGVGISAQDLPRIFNVFARGDKSRSRESGGVGLGLALAKRIVEIHGGTIEASSVLGQGSTFRLTVPALNYRRFTLSRSSSTQLLRLELGLGGRSE
jgi:two-component system, OmpR family, sensor kinase